MEIKKVLMFSIFLILLSSSVSSLHVEQLDKNLVVVSELNNPITFDLEITSDYDEILTIMSKIGARFENTLFVNITKGKNVVPIEAYLERTLLKSKGYVTFDYTIEGTKSGETKKSVLAQVISIDEIFDISGENIKVGDTDAFIKLKNKNNIALENIELEVTGEFFDYEGTLSFEKNETKGIKIPLNQNKILISPSGSYMINVEYEIDGKSGENQGIITYNEYKSVKRIEKSEGSIVRKNSQIYENQGNSAETISVLMNQDIVSRLLTIYSEEPTNVKRDKLHVYYEWKKMLNPGETYTVTLRVNYTLPLIILLIILGIIYYAKVKSTSQLLIIKNVVPVRTTDGKFAFRVLLALKAKRNISNIILHDYIPSATKLYDKFGKKPDSIDESRRKMSWNIGDMRSGEQRIISYIIYSNVDMVGQVSLPLASATFKSKDGNHNISTSNRTYFLTNSN
jgi:hypothetical protein